MKKKSKTIAFCSPFMNRDDDLKSTLAHNISILDKFSSRAVLHINIFNDNSNLNDWVTSNFSQYIKKGLIKLNKVNKIPYWHFSWAKNSFREFITEDYYSSLDGDNFLSTKTVEQLFSLIDKHEKVLFHGFSGVWGDGTSGQLTLPTNLYIKYGYIDEIYPRQYDEIGLIARALFDEPDLIFASNKNVDITKLSGYFKKAIEFKKIDNLRVFIDNEISSTPLNPRGINYVQENKILTYYQSFNSAYTFLKCIHTEESIRFHRQRLFKSLELLDNEIIQSVLNKTFENLQQPQLSSELTLYTVIKNDFHFLDSWLKHYRKLGVKRFIIIDDHSNQPLHDYISGNDIFIFKPLIGDFKNCKVYWIQLLLKAYQTEHSWAITVDSDELIDLTYRFSGLEHYINELEKNALEYSPSILIDMLPNKEFDIASFDDSQYLKHFKRAYIRPFGYDADYYRHHSIKWGFGKYSEYSFRFDARWRFFSTFDSLRKIPLFRYNNTISLNQGFHTISSMNIAAKSDELFSNPELILPIKHYKFVSFFMNKSNDSSKYHDRTKNNINRIKSTDKKELKKEIDLCPFVNDFSTQRFSEVFFKSIGLYRIISNDNSEMTDDDKVHNNLEFILKHETHYYDVDKIFILNQIANKTKLEKYIDTLKYHDAKFLVINSPPESSKTISFETISSPEDYIIKDNWGNILNEILNFEEKNKLIINNNNAKNYALEHGKNRYKWILPWDGDCFVNAEIIETLRTNMQDPKIKYLITPIQKLTENVFESLVSLPTNVSNEPQIAFRHDSKEIFNEKYIYSYQAKIELLKKLKVPGIWDCWDKIPPSRKKEISNTNEVNTFAFSSAVYRLAPKNELTAVNSLKMFDLRSYEPFGLTDNPTNEIQA